MPDVTVINIISTAYSGSTWLNLVLGSHSKAFSVGEIDYIDKYGRPRCLLHGEECPLWSQYAHESEENPYLQIARLTGRNVLIVNNSRRMRAAQNHPAIARRFILLARDGRAVVASLLRKYPQPTWRACRHWVKGIKRKRREVAKAPRAHVMTARYEDLLENFDSEIPRLCAFLDLDFEESMREYWTCDHHPVGGNPGTVAAIAKYQAAHVGAATAVDFQHDKVTDRDFYQAADPSKFRDERWKSELTDRQLRTFALIAGRSNRSFGYAGCRGLNEAERSEAQ